MASQDPELPMPLPFNAGGSGGRVQQLTAARQRRAAVRCCSCNLVVGRLAAGVAVAAAMDQWTGGSSQRPGGQGIAGHAEP